MKIPLSIFKQIGNTSGVYIFCDPEDVSEITDLFNELYQKYFNIRINEIIEENRDEMEFYESSVEEYYQNLNPLAKAFPEESRVFIDVEPPVIYFQGGWCHAYANSPLDKTLEEIRIKYPGTEYRGWLRYEISDPSGGNVECYMMDSTGKYDQNETFDFIGKKLSKRGKVLNLLFACDYEDFFSCGGEYNQYYQPLEESIFEIIDFICGYADWIDTKSLFSILINTPKNYGFTDLSKKIKNRIEELMGGPVEICSVE